MLPTGTVTFLFTDIEGSTRLAQQSRDAWEALRACHHAILRAAIEAQDGYVFQIIGDAFCAAFSTAEDAIRAAIKAQIDLNAEKWMEGVSIKVRMGIHTGKAEIQENGEYLGYLAMSRVQRLMSAAHGGQVVVSLAAQELVRDDLPENVSLRDMGEYRLKDILQPERIYQLVISGLAADFPPLKTLESLEHRPRLGLTVRLIGTFEIRFDNKPIIVPSRIAQALFAYLILNAGTSHRREKLAGMFWPNATEEKARAYLRHELWRIRKALPSIELLLVDDIGISFDPSTEYWLDTKLLGKLKDTASADELIAALSACQGELLPGFYDEWIMLEREHLQAVYEQKMARLLELLDSEKRWPEILEWAERWISFGQSPEVAYQYLMIAYDALGDRAKVASTYKRCVQALRQLDLEPSEQTRALAFKRTSKLNIPIPLTSFIGREKELEGVGNLLSKSRVVTLTGSGGVGKTRLAIHVVADVLEQFPDGVWFLDLAPLSDPGLVPNTLAEVLDLSLMGGSNLSITDLIIGYLRSRRALIIFDNCEHLIDPCARLVDSLLMSCERLSILATSREALRVSGEIPYRVPSLEVPRWDTVPVVDVLAKTESVRLFTERAAVVSPGFAIGPENVLVIGQICERLGGIPLAIELAAARVNMLAVEQILKRLDDRFNLLTSGLRTALPRHQTLRATIEWSFDLLSEKECLFFRRLAVFVGGWTLEAAEEVCGGSGIEASDVLDLLSQLVDKSLVLVETSNGGETRYPAGGSLRYRRLETIRQFACEKLAASSEGEQIRARHLEYFLKLAERSEQELPRRTEWTQKLEEEHENMRAALEWSLPGNVTAGQQLAGALAWWWDGSGHWSEGYEWLQKMLAVSTKTETLTRAKLLVGAGWLAAMLSYDDQSVAFAEESLALFRQLGDKEGIAHSLVTLAVRAYNRADFDQATALFEESCALSREMGDNWRLSGRLSYLGYTAEAQGNFEQAQKYYQESLMLKKIIGDREGFGWIYFLMGNLARSQGDNAEAMKLYEEALQIVKVAKQKTITLFILNAMGLSAIYSGDYKKGGLLLEETIELCQKMGDQAGIVDSLHWLGWGALLQGDYATSRSYYAESLQLVHDTNAVNHIDIAPCLLGVGQLIAVQGAPEKFARFVGMAESVAPDIQKMLAPLFRSETEKFIQMARTELGDEAYAAAWEAGHQMSLQDAVAYALRELL